MALLPYVLSVEAPCRQRVHGEHGFALAQVDKAIGHRPAFRFLTRIAVATYGSIALTGWRPRSGGKKMSTAVSDRPFSELCSAEESPHLVLCQVAQLAGLQRPERHGSDGGANESLHGVTDRGQQPA